ncbi:hypothetical protein J4E83_004269 [Alternaria metachromatica]|uniref:uncharacterized protein n=1 Tax=Alternaria metachromatica TaxID=283354 RepID=UPI0020C3D841|nr:uncharacterized protein J4E83_004269 [Alternaria metachromatica]KAI4624593.1 hypothetical protein J4E83_004269 [Alternaria metachromatica]
MRFFSSTIASNLSWSKSATRLSILYLNSPKMVSKDIEPCGSWSGDFTWDGYFMRMHMKTVTRKYDMHDPRTWPLVRATISTETGIDYGRSKVPPEYLVYEQALMKDNDQYRPLQGQRKKYSCGDETKGSMVNLFRYWPFNYNLKGELRGYPHIPPEEFEEWVSHYGRGVRTTTEEMDVKKTVDSATLDATTDTDSSEEAINDIMKMLDSTDTVASSRVTELEEELDKTRKESLEANLRAGRATKHAAVIRDRYTVSVRKFSTQVREQLDVYNKHYRNFVCQERTNLSNSKKLLATMTSKYEETKTRAEDAEKASEELGEATANHEKDLEKSRKEIERLEAEVKQSNENIATAQRETVAAKQEALMAKQQILKIREELTKKMWGTDLLKRKAGEDLAKTPRKKPKKEV